MTVDTQTEARTTGKGLKRSSLFQDWGIGSITCVPCNGGVLEYGTVTADKRGSTIGPEFQESQRPYRRTVFNGPDWVEHRSATRFEKAMSSTLTSGILRARYKEVAFVGAVATFVVCWNNLAAGYVDFDNLPHGPLVQHLPLLNIPTTVFTLTSPSLGLLLVFRTNACYARWDNSRRVWGDIINKCRSLVRQANTFMHDDYPGFGKFQDWRRRTAAETSAFTRCLRCFLRGPEDDQNLRIELKTLGFTPGEVDGYMASANRQCYALQQLGTTIGKASLDGRDRSRMDTTLSELCDDVGACERIFKTPIPIIYTRHTSRFVGFWLALLPLAIYSVDPSWNHLLTIPSVMVITFFLLGIEELGLQIEEPFSILPMEAFCDASIGAVLYDMVLSEDKARGLDRPQRGAPLGPTPTPVAPAATPTAETAPARRAPTTAYASAYEQYLSNEYRERDTTGYLATKQGGSAAAPPAPQSWAMTEAAAKAAWAPSQQPLPEPTSVAVPTNVPVQGEGVQDAVHNAVRNAVKGSGDATGRGGSEEGMDATRDSTEAAAATVPPPAPAAAPAADAPVDVHSGGGKGFGGGEATRDPAATVIDPSDPKAKQQAIHKAESFAEYLARRQA